ncbi:MAG: dTMP kinase [Candidatus Brennerbacteria bacterium]|nr:dTMP kinase [Candidatus Brennerbacteria bacterium]
MKPLLIAFEGIDGAGKLTQASMVERWLAGFSAHTLFLSEPNDNTYLGKTIRKMLKGEIPKPHPFEFQRLYVLQRAEDVACFIKPFFAKNGSVEQPAVCIMERYALSTIAYGMLAARKPESFIKLHQDVVGPQMIWPDLTILLDLPAEEAMRRIVELRGSKTEDFEKVETLRTVRLNYLDAANLWPFRKKIAVVDGALSPEEVFKEVKREISSLLARYEIHKFSTAEN